MHFCTWCTGVVHGRGNGGIMMEQQWPAGPYNVERSEFVNIEKAMLN